MVGGAGPFASAVPWWQHVEDVVIAAAGSGLDITVLRLLGGEPTPGWTAAGGRVTYLAELHGGSAHGSGNAVPAPHGIDLSPHPLRQPWAVPGGPAADLAWATAALASADRHLSGPPVQVRTWNLSSIWRLPLGDGQAWLKVVPPFFAHEAAVLRWVGARRPGLVPAVLAGEAGRVVLADVPGEDQYGAGVDVAVEAARRLADLQAGAAGDLDDLLGHGATDWRLPAHRREIEDSVARRAPALDGGERRALDELVDGLDQRASAIADCGVPDSLLHGDFHDGNIKRDGAGPLVFLDWGDSGVGHPLLDVAVLRTGRTGDDRAVLQATVEATWRSHVPGCDPARALDLLGPRADLRAAVVFERFLAAIEPAERCYHVADPLGALRRAASAGAVG